ncbi:MAG TPA: response regulator, partial [Holophagaceae bacterium]|nr:response regulator [Holophagaceae bacterium]
TADITFAPVRGAEDRVIAVSALIRQPLEPGAGPATSPPGARAILIVEDEPTLLELFMEATRALGHAATGAALGKEAIGFLEGGSYDLVVSDIRMPGLSGIELYAWIQAHRPDLVRKVLFTTGDAYDGATQAFLEEHHLPCLPKPFDLRQFQTKLGELLAI